MSHSHSYSSGYERPEYDFKDRYIRSLEEQVSLHKKQQQSHESQLKGLYARIAHLDSLVRAAQCSRCHKPSQNCYKMICEDCVSKDRLFLSQQQVINPRPLEGPACDSCRIRKRRCDRQKPHCSHCIKIHRNQPGLPKCTYPDKKRKYEDEEWPTPEKRLPPENIEIPDSPPPHTKVTTSPTITNMTNPEV